MTWYRNVSAGYFDVMGIKVKSGRTFQAREPPPL